MLKLRYRCLTDLVPDLYELCRIICRENPNIGVTVDWGVAARARVHLGGGAFQAKRATPSGMAHKHNPDTKPYHEQGTPLFRTACKTCALLWDSVHPVT